MTDRPPIARDTYDKYVDSRGRVSWPTDPGERGALARTLLGAEIVQLLDYWFAYAVDFVENRQSGKPFPRLNLAWKKDVYFRERFAGLSGEQKRAVRELIRASIDGVLFGVLCFLDHGDYGQWRMKVRPKNSVDENYVDVVPVPNTDLHDELSNWIYSLSRFAAEWLEFVPFEHGWQFRRIEPWTEA